jgi:Na+-translocating ferredoxin:NAD+ oxidoreductase subunit D
MKMMKGMLIALTPAIIWALYSYRLNALMLIVVSIAAAVSSEALYQYIFKSL